MMDKKIVAWALYDLANTAFTSPFATIFWPLLITTTLHGNEFHIGLTVAVATIIFSVIVPIIGSISDSTQIRTPFIVIPTLVMIGIIAFLPGFGLYSDLILAGIVIVAYNLSLTIYNALLPDLASEKEMGRISGYGMATGFIGTLLSLIVAYMTLWYYAAGNLNVFQALKSLFMVAIGKGGIALETQEGISMVFPVIAVFFLVFSLPLMFFIKDEKKKKLDLSVRKLRKISSGIVANIKDLFRIKGMSYYLAYFALFSNALAAIDIFFYLFAKNEIGMSLAGFIFLFMLQSFGAGLGAIVFGKMADRFGTKRLLQITTIMWILVISTFIFSRSVPVFAVAGLVGSVAFGGSLANSRTLFVFLAPEDKMGEYFGYAQIVSRLAAVIGPVLGGFIIVKYGYNYALLMMIAFVVACFFYLLKVPDLRGKSSEVK